MKTNAILLTIGLVQAILAADAKDVYTITGNLTSPLDLTAMPDYYADRIAVDASGEVTISGAITAGGVSIENPFQLIRSANVNTIVKESAGLGLMPLATVGKGKWTLREPSTYEMTKANGNHRLVVGAGSRIVFDYLVVAGDATDPGRVELTSSRIDTKQATFGKDGGRCEVVADNGYIYCGQYHLYLGTGSGTPAATVLLALTNTTIEAYDVFSSYNASVSSAEELKSDTVLVDIATGSKLNVRTFSNNGYARTHLKFTGGRYVARGNDTAIFKTLGNADYSQCATDVEGCGSPIDLTLGEGVNKTLTGGFNNSTGRPVNLMGTGGLVKRGAGTLTWNRVDSDSTCTYTGDTVIEGGSVVLAADGYTPAGSSLKLAEGTVFDLAGHTATFLEAIGAGVITNSASTQATLVLTKGVLSAKVLGDVKIVKAGSDELRVDGNVFSGDMEIREGNLKIRSHAASGYKHYRFKVDAVRGTESWSMQFSEFKLLDGDTDITQERSGFGFVAGRTGTNPSTSEYPSSETPSHAVDGNVATKWDDFRGNYARIGEEHTNLWIRLDYETARKATSYTWATANDYGSGNGVKCRDPQDWRLQGSDDGETWVDLDVRTGMGPYVDRKTYVGTFDLSYARETHTLGSVTLAKGATLDIRGVDLACQAFSNVGGTVLTSEEDSFVLDVEGEQEIVNPTLDLAGSLIKRGTGVATLIGTNTVRGSVKVLEGTLACRPYEYDGKYYRVSIYKNRDNVSVTQISEFSLFDAAGVRINSGTYVSLNDCVAASTLNEREVSICQSVTKANDQKADKLFDANTATKMCLQYWKPTTEKPLQFVFRLPNDTVPAAGYGFTTGNDSKGARNPVSWAIEGSADGVTWTLLDQKTDAETPAENCTAYNGGNPYRFTQLAASDDSPFGTDAVVEVAVGATLDFSSVTMRLAGLAVDCAAGAGTITGFSPENDGAIYLTELPSNALAAGAYVIPLTVGELQSASALKSWRVFVDGVPNEKCRVCWRDGKLILKQIPGMIMIFR